jgi:exopolysaccharide biosynthesis polyprenyl glycosylphosphotransferase
MSSLPVNGTQKPQGTAWAARLIPGAASALPRPKKNTTCATPLWAKNEGASIRGKKDGHNPAFPSGSEITCLGWLSPILRDYILVMFDWILIAQIQFHFFISSGSSTAFHALASGSPISPTLLEIGLLHGVLINLLHFPANGRGQMENWQANLQALAKRIFWGTLVLSAALQLQGRSLTAAALVWSAGVLHFVVLGGSQWAESTLIDGPVTKAKRNVLIIGSSSMGQRIAEYVHGHPEADRSLCGFLDDKKPLGSGIVGRISDLAALARSGFVDELILAPPHDHERTLRVLQTARELRLDVKIAPYLFGCEPAGRPESMGNIPLISLHAEKIPVGSLMMKRALDVAGASAALILITPALLLIALLIKVDSPGPVLYKATRAGHKGKKFLCYKFRTMQKNADEIKNSLRGRNQRTGPFFKIKDDPRVTRIGKFLRRYSLDELPQFWNVLRGEMSMVGPRPHPLDDVSAYAIQHLCRLDVLPGMTGLWQVTARQNSSFQTGMKLDIEYIHSWSLLSDLHILLKTAMAVWQGSGE